MTATIDPGLVDRAVRSEPEATAALLEQLRPGVVRYCRAKLGRVGGAYTTADDVAQDVCLALLKTLPRYRDQGRPFTAFVYAIAAHKVTDAQRAAVRHAGPAPVDTLEERPDAAPGPEQQAVSTDLARRLSVLLAQLPEQQREIVVLRVAAGLSAEEVGVIVGMSPAAVRVYQSRALAKLRTLAGDTLGEVAA
ncbi:RNA polymerase sigma factor ShbA [Dactylosporangium sp. NPDC051541]|uniref:RNA polymerase sigma factor ShbA n=1 Tax=Dactylosporangium sp. NPDC051541 TaxID=3363977 RepID=UPI0037B7D10F